MKIAHIIHTLQPNEGSDLIDAQPMTFESMIEAKQYALKRNPYNTIELLATVYEEDMHLIPDGFVQTKDLDDNLSNHIQARKLPFIKDILDRCYDYDPDYLIYTNVDIALTESFYTKVKSYIDLGHDAVIINRTTMPSYEGQTLDWFLQNIKSGMQHPGYDCFVIKKDLYEKMNLGKIVIGVNWIGEILLRNIFRYAENPVILQRPYMTFHMGDDRVWNDPKHITERNWNQIQAQTIISKFNNDGK